MKKQDRIAIRTPEHAAQVSRAERNKLAGSISLQAESRDTSAAVLLKVGDREIPATITFKGWVTFADLKTPGATQIHGGNILTGTILADLITAGVLRSKDEKSIVLDLERGRADITGSVNLSGENEKGDLVGSLRPGILQIARTGVLQSDQAPETEVLQTDQTQTTEPEVCVLRQVELTETGLVFTDAVNGKSLTLKLEDGGGRLTGLADPVDSGDAVNKAYMENHVWRKIDALREELGLPVG